MFTVITYDNDHNCTRYHEVVDAIDYDDAEQVVKGLYPNERLMGITYTKNEKQQYSSAIILSSVHLRFPQLNVESVENIVEKPVEKEMV